VATKRLIARVVSISTMPTGFDYGNSLTMKMWYIVFRLVSAKMTVWHWISAIFAPRTSGSLCLVLIADTRFMPKDTKPPTGQKQLNQ